MKFFYTRLAMTNLRKNRTTYFPYLLAGSMIVALFYILSSISTMVLSAGVRGGDIMAAMLQLSAVVCGIISLVVLFYINSFVIKRRKKEFGLYHILGMGKRHIAIVLFWETLFTGAVSIFTGIAGGALLSQLMFLLLLKIVRIPAALTFQIPLSAVAVTLLLFGIGYGIVFICDVISIGHTSAINLLNSSRQGEREPKARWILAVLGVLTLLAGYAKAMTTPTASSALMDFFPAVLLVIAGTFLLFIAGSVAFLKLLRRNKNFYYKPQNFIAVSGMLYRMKQNAVGLANICILSTCVLVTLSSTVCLFTGEEDLLNSRYPREIIVTADGAPSGTDIQVEQAALSFAEKSGYAMENIRGFYCLNSAAYWDGTTSFELGPQDKEPNFEQSCISLSDYNALTGENRTLAPGQAFLFKDGAFPTGDTITLGTHTYQIQSYLDERPPIQRFSGFVNSIIAVLPDLKDLQQLNAELLAQGTPKYRGTPALQYEYQFDMTGPEGLPDEFYHNMDRFFLDNVEGLLYVDQQDMARMDFYRVYGSLFFVGIFFVALFLIATVLIIYYKQITEGFDDHDRFRIMENVGMSDKEVRSAIRKQVLLVFFLPLGMAVLHILVAFRALRLLLGLFGMYNFLLFLGCVAGTVLVFSFLYFFVYRVTARTYYRIVQARA